MSTFRKTSLLITAFAFIFSHCLGQNEGTLTTDVMFPDVYPQIELQKVYADSYSEASLIKNVVLPGELGGAIPTDIIYLEGYNKFYVYGKRRLIVIDAITNTVTKSIEISSNSQYEPVERNGANQAWHESHLVLAGNFVYCATEEFKILRINPVDDAIETVVETPTNLSLDNYYNNMIIKYDARTNRIYWVISQFDGEYSTVLIYNASNFQLIQQLDLDHIDTYGTIEDIEINETLDEFYVGCSKGIRRYNANNFQLLEVIDENGEQKGDLLYINENGVHCLYCFPRTWGEEDAHIFKIDFTTNTTSSFISPLPTETACFYNENTNEIYVGFYPSGNNENNVFVINPMDNSIETGIATQMNSDPYWNFPIDFASYNNKVILCQRNEIVLIDEDNFSVEMVGNSLAENNMYYKCAVSANHALVTSPGGGNVQVINASNSIEETLEVGASLYFGCFNPAKNKAYFYTYFSPTGLIGKSKVYIYNTLTDEITIVEMGNNISDMFVYAPNEETNRVYVSTFEDTWIIKSIDGETDAITESGNGNWIYLDPDQGYCSSMFLAPNNKLYCMAGLDNEGSHEAGIEIFDANNDFELIELNKLSDMHGRLGGEFCYNSFNNKVYAVAKDMFPYSVYGKLVEIDGETDVVTFESNIGNNPWHIVCSPIKNKVYVQHGTSTTNLTVFDCNISSITSVSVGYPVWDIEYDPVRDLVFALYAESDTHKLGIVDDLSFFPGMKLPLSSCAIAYNPGNSSIYSYVAHNNANDEEAEMWECKLDYYDGVSVGFSSTQIPLGGKHTYKFDGHLANNDILFDENLNQIYVANGGHSNISVIGFDQQEPLVLHKGYNWISVPRHLRTNGNTTPTPTVFSQEKVSPGYDFINIDYNNISIEDGAGTLRPEFAQWDNVYHEWHYQSGEASVMKDIVSTRGYVMNAEPDGNRVLLLEGTVEDPATEIELYCKKENWIG
ncbi:MAG: hypothetical protein Q8O72_05440, partial [Bacteroidales bacterium]|nr:hypothetical protein [Bacteroidales bacterium]